MIVYASKAEILLRPIAMSNCLSDLNENPFQDHLTELNNPKSRYCIYMVFGNSIYLTKFYLIKFKSFLNYF